MIDSTGPLRTYRQYARDDTRMADVDWEQLATFLENSADAFRAVKESHGVELYRPRITDNGTSGTFRPEGWIGSYPGDVRVVPHILTGRDHSLLLEETSGWIETLGPSTARALLLDSLPKLLKDAESLLRSYSERLIEQTEAVLAHRPPVEIRREQSSGITPKGQPLPAATVRKRARGQPTTVVQNVKFTVNSIPNRLLVRFHAELAGALDDVAGQWDAINEEFDRRASYHRTFAEDGLSGDLLEAALTTDFDNPEVLAQARHQADPQLQEVIDLWESYRRETAVKLDIADEYASAVKPVEKVYELWILRLLKTILERETNMEGTLVNQDGDTCLVFGDDVRLWYDTRRSTQSRFLEPLVSTAYRPDFLLEERNNESWKARWVGDAKFKPASNLGSDDIDRFIRYMIDYVPADDKTPATATLLCARGEKSNQQHSDYALYVLEANPSQKATCRERLEQQICRRLS